ncbi:hypothetical protein [Streptomyces sp. NPDC002088]|uniref:hypothetical protein n=1 Tax=Streptomyces sp. NPDC002088 TaxID=3154665 RepID=UPI003328CE34
MMAFFLLLAVIVVLWFVVTAVRGKREAAAPPAWTPDEEPVTGPVPSRHVAGAGARDIPSLYPDFYHGVLFAVGKEASPQNLLALIEYVGQMVTANAVGWFHQTGDMQAYERFMDRFRGGGGDEQKLETIPDDMIDFLWAWRPSTHQALRDWIPELQDALTGPDSRLWRFPGELPFGIWSMEE